MVRKIIGAFLLAVFFFSAVRTAFADSPVTLGRGSLTSIALSPDGTRLAVGTTIGVYFYDAQTFAPQEFWASDLVTGDLLWSPRSDILLSLEYCSATAFASNSGEKLWAMRVPEWNCDQWAFTQTGEQISVIAGEAERFVFDSATGNLVERLPGPDYWPHYEWMQAHTAPTGIRSADGKLVAINCRRDDWEKYAFIYDVPNRMLAANIPITTAYGSCYGGEAKLNHTGKRIAIAKGASIEIWGLPIRAQDGPQTVLTDPTSSGWFYDFRWSLDNRTLYAIANNQVVAIEVETGKILRTIGGFSQSVGQMVWSTSGQQIVGTSGSELAKWDLTSHTVVQTAKLGAYLHSNWGMGDTIDMVASPKGDLIAAADRFGVTLYDTASLKALHRLNVGRQVVAMAFTPDGRLIATGGVGPFINVWDTTTGYPVKDLLGTNTNRFIAALAFDTNGNTLYALEGNGRLRKWDLAAGTSTFVQTTAPQINYYYDPAIHIRTNYVATERGALGLDVSDIQTGELKYTLSSDRWPRSIIINASGSRLAAIVDGKAKVWDLPTGTLLATYSTPTDWRQWVMDITFSPDGTRLAVSSRNGTVKIYNVP